MNIKDLLKDAYREGMTLEEIEAALESIDMPTDGSAEIERLTKALSKSNSEAADYKKQLREKMSAEDIKAKEDADKWAEMEEKYNALVKKDAISTNTAKLLALGYEEKLAAETAEAMFNGDTEKVFANQKLHLDSVEKKVRADVLKDTPKPTGGSGKGMSMDDIMKIKDPVERQTAIASNIELFEKE